MAQRQLQGTVSKHMAAGATQGYSRLLTFIARLAEAASGKSGASGR